jgi:hypothetical protein
VRVEALDLLLPYRRAELDRRARQGAPRRLWHAYPSPSVGSSPVRRSKSSVDAGLVPQ